MRKITPARLVRGSDKSSRQRRRIAEAAFETLERRQLLTTYVVDKTVDLDDGNYSVGELTLREAVNLANASVGVADVINFDVPLLNPNFLLFAGSLNITDNLQIDGTNLNAAGGQVTVNVQLNGSVINVAASKTVSVQDITLRNGRTSFGGGVFNAGDLTLTNVLLTNNSATTSGGGVYNTGTLTLAAGTVVTISNASSTGGGAFNDGGTLILNGSTISAGTVGALGVGGGIYNDGGSVTLTNATVTTSAATDAAGIYNTGSGTLALTGSTISNNNAVRFGGGIFNTGTSSVTLTNSLISGNSSGISGSGGGIYSLSGSVTITGSTVSNNRTLGSNGGGIRNAAALSITDSTISGNISNSNGGGVFTTGASSSATILRSTISGNSSVAADGGGIASTSSSVLKIANSTISGNQAARNGGGILVFSGTPTITNTTITNNRADSDGNATGTGGALYLDSGAPTVTVNNSIVADNFVGVGAVEDDIQQVGGTVVANNNLIGTGGSGGVVHGVNGNQVGIANPLLGALANNGGSTMTHELLFGSPAKQIGSNVLAVDSLGNPLTTDQRSTGFARIHGGVVDAGAYEAPTITFIVDKTVDLNDGNFAPGELTLREAVQLANANPGPDTILFNVGLLNPNFLMFAGTLGITDSVTIDGTNLNAAGGQAIVNMQNNGSVIDVAAGQTVSVADITLRQGRTVLGGGVANAGNLTLTNVLVTASSATSSGGGVYNTGTLTINGGTIISGNNSSVTGGGIHNTGTLIVTSSTIQTNTVNAGGLGGGIWNSGSATLTSATVATNTASDGAGIYNTLSSGTVVLNTSNVTNNNAASRGGGIFLTNSGSVTLNSTTVSGNTSGITGGGGGLYSLSGTISLNSSTVTNNRTLASNGGGIRNAGTLNVTSSTISNNISNAAGAGIFNTGSGAKTTVLGSTISGNNSLTGDGAGIATTLSAQLRVLNSTISGNTAARNGGAIHVFSGSIVVTNTTITNNRADFDNNAVGIGGAIYLDSGVPTVTLNNTIVADNFVGVGAVEDDIQKVSGTVTGNNNLIGTGGSGGLVHGASGNQVGIANPMLGPLANNGGSTLTHLPAPGSPVIHAGNSTLAVHPDTFIPFATDQRGGPRFLGTFVDIGSVEVNVPLSLIVDKTVDLDDGNYGVNELTLREAINLANANPGLDTIQISVSQLNPLFSLFGGALAITDSVNIDGTNLHAAGGNAVITANNASLALSLTSGDTAVLADMTIRNGRASLGGGVNNAGTLTLTNVIVTQNTATLNGGGIYNTGTLTLNGGTTVSNGNASTTGAGIYNTGTIIMTNATIGSNVVAALGIGGGIYNAGGILTLTNSTISSNSGTDGAGIYNLNTGSVTLTNSTISNNSATRFGGGIYNTSNGSVVLINSVISGNSAGVSGSGGAIYSLSGTVSLTGTTITNNRSFGSNGGGIRNAGTLNITSSTISNNISNSNGGGIFNIGPTATTTILNSTISGNQSVTADGAGIATTSGALLRVINSTISGNNAARNAGGIHAFSGTVQVTNTTITNNRADSDNNSTGSGGGLYMDSGAATVTLNNTILADNFFTGAVESDIVRVNGSLNGNSSLIGTGGSGGLLDGVSGNQVGVANPRLGVLANNGGPTQTHRLLVGSTAIDTGNNALAVDHLAVALTGDQRSNPRIGNGTVDIGAVENTINLNGAVVTNEGATYSLTIGPVVDNAADITEYRIDWGDGIVDTLTAAALAGMSNIVTHVYVDDDPTATQFDPYTINLEVKDAFIAPSFMSAAFKDITVNNVNPTVSIAGAPVNGVSGSPINLTGSFTDPGIPEDSIDDLTWTVHKNGVQQAIQSGLSTSFTYTPTSPGHYVIKLAVTDDDTGTGTLSKTVHVSGAQIQTDPTDALKTALFVYGTAGNDTIELLKLGVSLVRVKLNGVLIGTFAPTGRVIVQGGTGNDTVTNGPVSIVQKTMLYGGEGNDTLNGNGQNDVLVGGEGDDVLVGNGGDDLLIGGNGADNLNGGADEDLLIGGSTAYDFASESNMNSLAVIKMAWSTGGAAAANPLLAGNVTDDAFADILTGGLANDLFYADSVLDITDAIAGDTTVPI